MYQITDGKFLGKDLIPRLRLVYCQMHFHDLIGWKFQSASKNINPICEKGGLPLL